MGLLGTCAATRPVGCRTAGLVRLGRCYVLPGNTLRTLTVQACERMRGTMLCYSESEYELHHHRKS